MAKKKDEKTNVMRILDQKKIPYIPHFYEEEEGPEGTRDYGVHVAQALGQDPKRAFKTLAAKGASGAYHVFDIPATDSLDLKKAAKAAGYVNAGTIEFLLDKENNFYFMEMNTRIQVEHPVTEWVTGVDLVKAQIKIAAGEKLEFAQKDIKIRGHAIECRINAENPEKGFRPSPGTIEDLYLPGGKGIRIDTAVYSGYTIPVYYDSMIAKLIVWGKGRKEAIRKMQSALGEVIIEGVDTNVDYQYEILHDQDYLNGNIDVEFIQRFSAP